MLSDWEPKYKRPRRLCIGVTREEGKPIYAEGFGGWKREEYTFLDEDSDDTGFEVRFHSKILFWWAWNLTEVLAEEAQMELEEDHWHNLGTVFCGKRVPSSLGDTFPIQASAQLPGLNEWGS